MSNVLLLTISSVVPLIGCLSILLVGSFVLTHTREFPARVRLTAALVMIIAAWGVFLALQLLQMGAHLQGAGV